MDKLIRLLASWTLEDVYTLERADEQFVAIASVVDHTSSYDRFLGLCVLNALITFQIGGTGDQRRREFCDSFFSHDTTDSHYWRAFLSTSRYNKRIIETKIKRVETFLTFWKSRSGWFEECAYRFYTGDQLFFHTEIAHVMKQPLDAKTICMASKMFGYAVRARIGTDMTFDSRIFIPIDSRLTKIALQAGVHPSHKSIHNFRKEVLATTSLPPLHVDSVMWLHAWQQQK